MRFSARLFKHGRVRGNQVHKIETGRLIIRGFDSSDWRDLFEYLSDPDIYIYEPGEPTTPQQAKELAQQRSDGTDFWAVVLKQQGKVIGHLHFKQIEPHELLTWELGYIFNPAYQRCGCASEAALALVRYAFANYGTHRVVAHCNPDNVASWKVLERVGFKREGLLRKNVYFRKAADGTPLWTDTYEYGILETDI
jgi:ribosomal-protein-alanine N-acetyltransferase